MRVAEGDSVPLVGSQVVLHEVTIAQGQPIDSTVTRRDGRYDIGVAALDTAASYLVSVEHGGVGYFSQPFLPGQRSTDTIATLVVYDTSYGEPRILLSDRNIIVQSARRDGTRRVIELLQITNPGSLTRITDDTSTPVWQAALPSQAIEFEVGDADVSPQAVYRRGDRIAVAAPIPPGMKQILVSYLLPSGVEEASFAALDYIDHLNVLLEEAEATVAGPAFRFVGLDSLGESSFNRYAAGGVEPGAVVTLRLPRLPRAPQVLSMAIVLLTTVVLVAALWWWMRRRRTPVVARGVSDDLARQIAALDRAFENKGTDVTTEERKMYEQRRTELKARLSEVLAADRGKG